MQFRRHGSPSHWPAHSPSTPDYYRESDRNEGRSASRASNMSIKRTAEETHPRPTDSDRKKIAMQKVAENWNEYLQIIEAERHEALQEIALPEHRLHRAKEDLDKSASLLDMVGNIRSDLSSLRGSIKKIASSQAATQQSIARFQDTYSQDQEWLAERLRGIDTITRATHKNNNETKLLLHLITKQLKDLSAIDILNSRLQSMSKQVPRVANLNTAFNSMVDVNQAMRSNALYLGKERHWVNKQLSVKSRAVSSHKQQQIESGTRSPYFNKQRSTVDMHSQGERYRRKVVVVSPALDASSPPPAPTVTQEQARRREASNPRSILRLSNASQQETESLGPPSRPDIVEEIRSSLVRPKFARSPWGFPTMEDYAKEMRRDGKDGSIRGKKHSISLVDDEEDIVSPVKRVKSVVTPGASLRTGPIVRKTYSKKQSN
ncbi:hypothetical protein IL306_011169 [Fusarium sp. DS 682]|nr:hypothetical protein IL306_011169 [Fusarium sp. DS 682]